MNLRHFPRDVHAARPRAHGFDRVAAPATHVCRPAPVVADPLNQQTHTGRFA